jgi:hypothetical protein
MSQIAVATTIGTVLDRSRMLRCDALVYAEQPVRRDWL